MGTLPAGYTITQVGTAPILLSCGIKNQPCRGVNHPREQFLVEFVAAGHARPLWDVLWPVRLLACHGYLPPYGG